MSPQNDLYCVGWGVKLYSLYTYPEKFTQNNVTAPFLQLFVSICFSPRGIAMPMSNV